MKIVIWTDDKGIKHRSILQEHQVETRPEEGYVSDVPDIFSLDWEQIKKELHNALTDRKLFTYEDVVHSQNGITGAVLLALRKRVKDLYRRR